MNSILLSGYMGKDPEIRVTREGKSVASFSLGVGRRFQKDTTDWFKCTAFGKTAEFVEKYLRKGNKIILKGEMQNDNYQGKDGKTVYGFNVIVEQVEFADSKQSKEETKEEADPQWMQVDEEEIPFK